MIRVALLGVGHWHLPNYLAPLQARDDISIVAVSDPNKDVARALGERLDCAWTTDFRSAADPAAVDFAFALGRHCDMASQGMHLVEAGIPFAMEKPCGVDESEVAALTARAEARGAFAAVPFVWRQTEFMDAVHDLLSDDSFEYLSLRIVSGHPDRYIASGNPWMLDPALAGGGSTLNLGVHLVDLFRVLAGGQDITVESARMSNLAFGLPIEDWSALLLRASGGAECVIETGFLFPAPTGTYDARFTIKTDRHYVMTDTTTTTILDTHGGRVTRSTAAANEPAYALFVNDVLDRHRRGMMPLAGLVDMRIVYAALTRAYDLAGPLPLVTAPAGSAGES